MKKNEINSARFDNMVENIRKYGGAPMERDAAHHWLQVDVAEGCLAADDPPAADAPCGGCQAGQACTAEGCAPCVTLTKVEFSP